MKLKSYIPAEQYKTIQYLCVWGGYPLNQVAFNLNSPVETHMI